MLWENCNCEGFMGTKKQTKDCAYFAEAKDLLKAFRDLVAAKALSELAPASPTCLSYLLSTQSSCAVQNEIETSLAC